MYLTVRPTLKSAECILFPLFKSVESSSRKIVLLKVTDVLIDKTKNRTYSEHLIPSYYVACQLKP